MVLGSYNKLRCRMHMNCVYIICAYTLRKIGLFYYTEITCYNLKMKFINLKFINLGDKEEDSNYVLLTI